MLGRMEKVILLNNPVYVLFNMDGTLLDWMLYKTEKEALGALANYYDVSMDLIGETKQ